jgi:biopolymer transport protein TolR
VQISIDERRHDVSSAISVVAEAELPSLPRRHRQRDGASEKPRQVLLRADTRLDYGKVMRVMGELNRAGLNKVSLVTTGEGKN